MLLELLLNKRISCIYKLNTFTYQLLDYTNYAWYHMEFHGNRSRAKNGEDHTYGEYMHSDICSVSETEVNIYQHLSSYIMVQQNYFVYEPDVNLTLHLFPPTQLVSVM